MPSSARSLAPRFEHADEGIRAPLAAALPRYVFR
jgi:hypothetical protein